MAGQYHTKNGRTSKRGLFVDGVWHCDCEPRLPADKFQTKNGGKNHGRWFYTCQRSQPKRCSFFLWSDEAKIREESALLHNSTSEPVEPHTPRRSTTNAQPLTPFSKPRSDAYWSHDVIPNKFKSPPTKFPSPTRGSEDDDIFDWSSSGDEDLAAIADAVTRENTAEPEDDEESPRKVARTLQFTSPSKRTHKQTRSISQESSHTLGKEDIDDKATWPFSDDVFLTPSTTTRSHSDLLSPFSTKFPTQSPISNEQQQQSHPSNTTISASPIQLPPPHHSPTSNPTTQTLTASILSLLAPVNLPQPLTESLTDMLTRHELRTQGIVRGRDITRQASQAKDKKIAELQTQIAALESERETSRAVIAHLKQDIASSPPRRRIGGNIGASGSRGGSRFIGSKSAI